MAILRVWSTRTFFSLLLMGYFCFTIYMGPVLIIGTTLLIQMKCFSEIINIAHGVYKLRGFRFLSWYFLAAGNYFFYGENLSEYFGVFVETSFVFKMLLKHHRFLSFCVYFLGVVLFVVNLGKDYDREQFALLAWTHVSLLIIVSQSYMIVRNVFQGLIWLILPVSMVFCNDIFAYGFGFFYGKTPLIQLSPKKTWEGFIGGGIVTLILGLIVSHILCQFQYFVCPIEYQTVNETIKMVVECEPAQLYQIQNYSFRWTLLDSLEIDGYINCYPFIFHAFFLAIFSSLLAPFGGFFASGFKRAFHVKDFGNIIPGHGGILDRFDCQFLMATFVNVYISSFIKNQSMEEMFSRVLDLKDDEQVQLFYSLRNALRESNLLEN